MFKKEWLRILLRNNWQSKIIGKARVYSLGVKNRELVNNIFDEFYDQGRLDWTITNTPFNYLVFIIWRNILKGRKSRVIVNIKGFN